MSIWSVAASWATSQFMDKFIGGGKDSGGGFWDKALSAGESSTIYIKYIEGKNSQIGIASKDSSTVFLNNLNFNNVKSCLSAYNKKQEFNGGVIKFENEIICDNFVNKFEIDKFSEITKQGKFNQ